MELPPFDILWQTSEKLSELESVLEELDRVSGHQKAALRKRRRKRRDGLYGARFAVEDKGYYEPLKYCCDEAFYTEFEYETHVAGHVKCDFEGCTFVGEKKQLRVHKEVVHDGGLFEKIYQSDSAKSILEWREARKRNYPTSERVAIKRELLQQRLARGQVFKTPEFGTLQRKRPAILKEKDLEVAPGEVSLLEVTTERMAADANQESCGINSGSTIPAPNSVQSLVGDAYDSDVPQSDSEKAPSELVEAKRQATPPPARGRRCRGGKRNRSKLSSCRTANSDPQSSDEGKVKPPRERNPFTTHPVVQMQSKRRACTKNPDRVLSRPTLLHMLLAEEMRKERNQLMQCIRYVVQHNFFSEDIIENTGIRTCDVCTQES